MRWKISIVTVASAGIILALGSIPAQAARGPEKRQTQGFRPEERELVVQTAYTTLARYIAAAGKPIRFTLAEMRTIPAAELGEIAWTDVVTLPGGDMIDVHREERSDPSGESSVRYVPSWNLGKEEYVLSAEGQLAASLSVGGLLERLSGQQKEAARAEALTAYEVTVTLEGRTRTYRAVALWIPVVPAGGTRVHFVDHITQGLEESLYERPADKPRPAAPLHASRTKVGTVCQETSAFYTQSNSAVSSSWHVWGKHTSSAEAEFACHCNSECLSTCQATFTSRVCEDEGTPLNYCHVMASNSQVGIGSNANGLTEAAGCAAAFGCVQKSCPFCLCSLGIEIGIRGSVVTWTPSGNPDWSEGNFEFSHVCPVCEPVPEETGGGGGGGGGGPDIQGDGEVGGGGGGGPWGGSCHSVCNSGHMVGSTFFVECWTVCS